MGGATVLQNDNSLFGCNVDLYRSTTESHWCSGVFRAPLVATQPQRTPLTGTRAGRTWLVGREEGGIDRLVGHAPRINKERTPTPTAGSVRARAGTPASSVADGPHLDAHAEALYPYPGCRGQGFGSSPIRWGSLILALLHGAPTGSAVPREWYEMNSTVRTAMT